jgi:hypothetical protein
MFYKKKPINFENINVITENTRDRVTVSVKAKRPVLGINEI